jgi:hypothetical protein
MMTNLVSGSAWRPVRMRIRSTAYMTDIGSSMSRLPGTTGVPIPEIPVLFHQQLLRLQADLWLEHSSHKKTYRIVVILASHGEN